MSRVARRRVPPLHPGQPFARRCRAATAGRTAQADHPRDAPARHWGFAAAPPCRARNSCRSLRAAISRESFCCAGQRAHIRPLDHHRQPQSFRRAPDQALVGVAAPATQPMIQMRHRQLPAMLPRQFMQHVQQHHRIHPAGNRHQDALPRAKEPAGADALLNVVQQFTHVRMLFQQPRDARRIEPPATFVGKDAFHRLTGYEKGRPGFPSRPPTQPLQAKTERLTTP